MNDRLPLQHPHRGPSAAQSPDSALSMSSHYRAVRTATEHLVGPLSAEDCVIQSMPDASPVKWHLAHTSWFFETFVLAPHLPGYRLFHPSFRMLFNSYYNSVGEKHPRPRRGLLSRPSLEEVRAYRAHVDAAMAALMDLGTLPSSVNALVELGLNHEQQHQELILTDVLHMLSCNPLKPAYAPPHQDADVAISTPLAWIGFGEGVVDVGHDGSAFAFDNESPRHRQYLNAFSLASRAVTNGEYLAFLDDAGYRRPELWLSEGWDWLAANSIDAPLYWQHDGDGHGWLEFGLRGLKPLELSAPVCHVSLFEADAYARWADARLPSEGEWEIAASGRPVEGNFIESGALAPRPADAATVTPSQLFGDVWEWTQSAYAPYPGYLPAAGAIGEYNGKFMCNQYVLRGGSCVSPTSHLRATYRNFFPASARWQFTGIRLARDSG